MKNYPYKADAYDSLADGLKANGQLNEALKMMNIAIKKSMNENVENNSFKTHLVNLLALIKENNLQSAESVFDEKYAESVEQ